MLCQQAGKEYIPSYVRNGSLTNQRLSSPVWRLVRMLAGVYLLVLRHSYSVALVGMELRILPRKWWECRCEPHVLQRLLVALGSLDGQTITIPQPEEKPWIGFILGTLSCSWNPVVLYDWKAMEWGQQTINLSWQQSLIDSSAWNTGKFRQMLACY